MYVVFDTETSGLFNFGKPPEAEGQPRLASIAFLFLDDALEVQQEHYKLIRPDGWKMPYGATVVNGLTQQMLEQKGVPVSNILTAFNYLADQGATFVAHNIDFDLKVLRGEMRRARLPDRDVKAFCTMKSMTSVCRIKAKRGYKWPKLIEAYSYLFGEKFDDAHEALADARACARIFQHGVRNGLLEAA